MQGTHDFECGTAGDGTHYIKILIQGLPEKAEAAMVLAAMYSAFRTVAEKLGASDFIEEVEEIH